MQEEKEGIKGLYDEALARSRELETELSSLRGVCIIRFCLLLTAQPA